MCVAHSCWRWRTASVHSTLRRFAGASRFSMRLEEMQDEPLAGYREAVRRRLQELMLRENYPPGHPLVLATSHHLDMASAAEAAQRFSAPGPGLAHFYRGCDLFYSVPVRPVTPSSPDQKDTPLECPAKITI